MSGFKTVSLADQVFEKLEGDIIRGVYARGELLTEMKLVEQLGVSRTPIREVLRRLEQEGLIRDTRKGALVLGITLEDLKDIMDIRQRVEGLAAFYATRNADDQGRAELRKIADLQEFYFQQQDVENLRTIDDRFHDFIYELSGRAVIRDTLLPLHKKTQRYRKVSIQDNERMAHSVAEHRAIAEAIISGDAEKAESLAAEHIQNARESMMRRCASLG